jgi:hypothetical protein
VDDLARDARETSVLIDGSVPIQHSLKTLSMIRASADAGHYLMGGAPGDVSAGSKIPGVEYLYPEKRDALTLAFCRARITPPHVLSDYFRQEVLDECLPRLETLVAETLADYDVETAAERVTLWSMEHRWPHFQFTSPIHNHPLVSESSPFLGYAYNDCMLSVPGEWLYQRSFYFFMIFHMLPDLRDIVYANTGRPLDGELFSLSRPGLVRRAARHAKRRLYALRTHLARRKIKAAPVVNQFMGHVLRSDPRIFDDVRATLEQSRQLAEIYDIGKCREQLDRFERYGELGEMPVKRFDVLGALICLAYYTRQLT